MPEEPGAFALPASSPTLEERAATLLTWIRVEHVGALARAGFKAARRKGERPLPAAAEIFETGAVLAEVLVEIGSLHHAHVLRSPRRPASAPVPAHPESQSPPAPSPAYRQNVRRVLHALAKDFARTRLGNPLAPGAMASYIGADVTSIPPAQNVAPSIALAELVATAAMYSSRSAYYLGGLQHLSCETPRRVLPIIIRGVAASLGLPPLAGLDDRVDDARSRSIALSHHMERKDGFEGMGDRKFSLITEESSSPMEFSEGNRLSAKLPSPSSLAPNPNRVHVHNVQVRHMRAHTTGPGIAGTAAAAAQSSRMHGQSALSPEDSRVEKYLNEYNNTDARLQEISRTRAMVSRLEGTVLGPGVFSTLATTSVQNGNNMPAMPPPDFKDPRSGAPMSPLPPPIAALKIPISPSQPGSFPPRNFDPPSPSAYPVPLHVGRGDEQHESKDRSETQARGHDKEEKVASDEMGEGAVKDDEEHVVEEKVAQEKEDEDVKGSVREIASAFEEREEEALGGGKSESADKNDDMQDLLFSTGGGSYEPVSGSANVSQEVLEKEEEGEGQPRSGESSRSQRSGLSAEEQMQEVREARRRKFEKDRGEGGAERNGNATKKVAFEEVTEVIENEMVVSEEGEEENVDGVEEYVVSDDDASDESGNKDARDGRDGDDTEESDGAQERRYDTPSEFEKRVDLEAQKPIEKVEEIVETRDVYHTRAQHAVRDATDAQQQRTPSTSSLPSTSAPHNRPPEAQPTPRPTSPAAVHSPVPADRLSALEAAPHDSQQPVSDTTAMPPSHSPSWIPPGTDAYPMHQPSQVPASNRGSVSPGSLLPLPPLTLPMTATSPTVPHQGRRALSPGTNAYSNILPGSSSAHPRQSPSALTAGLPPRVHPPSLYAQASSSQGNTSAQPPMRRPPTIGGSPAAMVRSEAYSQQLYAQLPSPSQQNQLIGFPYGSTPVGSPDVSKALPGFQHPPTPPSSHDSSAPSPVPAHLQLPAHSHSPQIPRPPKKSSRDPSPARHTSPQYQSPPTHASPKGTASGRTFALPPTAASQGRTSPSPMHSRESPAARGHVQASAAIFGSQAPIYHSPSAQSPVHVQSSPRSVPSSEQAHRRSPIASPGYIQSQAAEDHHQFAGKTHQAQKSPLTSPGSDEYVDAQGSTSPPGDGTNNNIGTGFAYPGQTVSSPHVVRSRDPSPGRHSLERSVSPKPLLPQQPAYVPSNISSIPPSPPSVKDVIQSFSSNLDSSHERPGRVSTMSPSPGLFQKLISVWQNPDEAAATAATTQAPGPASEVTEATRSGPAHIEAGPGPRGRSPTPMSDDSGLPRAQSPRRAGRPLAMRIEKSPLQEGAGYTASPSLRHETSTSLAEMKQTSPRVDVVQQDGFVPDSGSNVRGRSRSTGRIVDADLEWEAALKGELHTGEPSSSEVTTSATSVAYKSKRAAGMLPERQDATQRLSQESQQSMSPTIHTPPSINSLPENTSNPDVVRVDRKQLDWLTQELLAARDAINRKSLQLTLAEKESEVLVLERQDAESVVSAMKRILAERENELREARHRLSAAIQDVSRKDPAQSASPQPASLTRSEMDAKIELEARRRADVLYTERAQELKQQHATEPQIGNAEIMARFDRTDALNDEAAKRSDNEMRRLFGEVQSSMEEKMTKMIERRDAELAELRIELSKRQKKIDDLQTTRLELVDANASIQSEAASAKQERELIITQAAMEISQVQAQLVLVDKFSKKLHDTFKETEMLRAQVADSQAKMAAITSNAGISAREAKELREAVSRAQAEADRWRKAAESAKSESRELGHRADEYEHLFRTAQVRQYPHRYQDRHDPGYSSEKSDYANRSGGSRDRTHGNGRRYQETGRIRALPQEQKPAAKMWTSIMGKVMPLMGGKEMRGERIGTRKPPRPRQRHHISDSEGRRQQAHAVYRSPQQRSPQYSHGELERQEYQRSRSESEQSQSSHGSGSRQYSDNQYKSPGSGHALSPNVPEAYLHHSPIMQHGGRRHSAENSF